MDSRLDPVTLVAVFGDVHAHAEALEAVVEAAERHGAEQLWSLGDMWAAARIPNMSSGARANGAAG